MVEWPKLSLRNAGVALIDCDHRTPPATISGYAYVAIPQLREGHIDMSSARRISKQHFIDWTRKAKPIENDVVLSRRTNPGVTAFVPKGAEFALGQNLVLLRADGKKVFPPFLRWLVSGPEWWEQIGKFLNVGAVFDSLKCADVPNFELHIPPLSDQRAIAHVLGTLDDKIKLNRRMNEALETMARALFKSWFLDFNPVRVKSQGRDIELPKALADQFPNSFEDSDIGEIPKGWKAIGLDGVAAFLNGLALQKFPPKEGRSLPVIKISQLRSGNTSDADRASSDIDGAFIVEDGDILFSWSGSLECVLWAGGQGALNQHLFKVTSTNYPRWLCFLGIQHHLDGFRHIAAGKATTMGHIQRHHLSEAKLLLPNSPEFFLHMNSIFEPMIESIWRRNVMSRTLAAIRDTLLPKLISGEIRVKDAERFVEAGV